MPGEESEQSGMARVVAGVLCGVFCVCLCGCISVGGYDLDLDF